jgi:TetR/AcrR family transcriptional regulator
MPELPESTGAVVRLLRPLALLPATAAPVDERAAGTSLSVTSMAGACTADGNAQRKRPRPGERRLQILQTLAAMLEQPGSERITTAALAARLEVSEAALYRHFASKAQMFEGLIEFIESTVFGLVNQIAEREAGGSVQARRIVVMLLQFGEMNPGMVRVMVGDALVFEHERLSLRMNQFFDRIEGQLRQCLRLAAGPADGALAVGQGAHSTQASAPDAAANVVASGLTALVIGRLQRFARSGFRRSPTEHLDELLARLTV